MKDKKVQKTNRDQALLILDWCIKKFGKSKYQVRYPKLKFLNKPRRATGNFDWTRNTITIFTGRYRCSNYDVCKSMLHEYKHYLLDGREYNKIADKLYEIYGKDTAFINIWLKHPHEIKCDELSQKWSVICYNKLRYKLDKLK